jgi:hypothetical protein
MENKDELRMNNLCDIYGLEGRILTTTSIRLTDGEKILDLYSTKYFKVSIKERGDITTDKEIIEGYFSGSKEIREANQLN